MSDKWVLTRLNQVAGEISKDLTNRLLLAPDIVKAHQEGRCV